MENINKGVLNCELLQPSQLPQCLQPGVGYMSVISPDTLLTFVESALAQTMIDIYRYDTVAELAKMDKFVKVEGSPDSLLNKKLAEIRVLLTYSKGLSPSL